MLKKYTPELKKIAMGVLTYNKLRIKATNLENQIEKLTSNPENEIYLWRGPDNHYDGLVIIEKYDKSIVVVKKIILRNNLKNTEMYNTILNGLQNQMPDKIIMGVEKLKDIFLEWEKILKKI